jgi:hypothetical protein
MLAKGLKSASIGSNKIQFVGGRTAVGTAASVSYSLSAALTGGIASTPSVGDLMIVIAAFTNSADTNMTSTTANPMTKLYDLYSAGVTLPGNHLGAFYRTLTSADFTTGSNGFSFGVSRPFSSIALYYRGVNSTLFDTNTQTFSIQTLTKNSLVLSVSTVSPSAGDSGIYSLQAGDPMTLLASVLPGTDSSKPYLAARSIILQKPQSFTPEFLSRGIIKAAEIRGHDVTIALRSAI